MDAHLNRKLYSFKNLVAVLLKNPGKIKKAQPGGFNWVNPGLNGFYWAGG